MDGIETSENKKSAILNIDDNEFIVSESQQVYGFTIKKIEKDSVLIQDKEGNVIGIPIGSN